MLTENEIIQLKNNSEQVDAVLNLSHDIIMANRTSLFESGQYSLHHAFDKIDTEALNAMVKARDSLLAYAELAEALNKLKN